MDFDLPPEATDAAALAATILADHCTPERLRAVDQQDDRFDERLWTALGAAGLIGLAVPDRHGGAGLGLVELAAVLQEAGRTLAPVPLANHAVAALTIAELADEATQDAWLPRAATGEVVLTVADAPDRTGAWSVVEAGTRAAAILLPVPDEDRLVLVTPDTAGVSIEPQGISDGDLAARITLDPTTLGAATTIGAAGAVRRARELLTVARVAHQVGVVDGALRLTASYAGTREQFGRAIGTFQAVSQRLADGYIDVLGARLVLWQAAWRLSEGLPSSSQVASAALWAADAGHRIAHTTVHVHGGVGIDLDGDAHRYFTAAKRGELLLGGTTAAARAIGAELAAAG